MTAPGIPFYVHPAADPEAWCALGERFADADGARDGFVVLNIADGPGESDDPYYPEAIAALRTAAPGLLLAGYVDVAHGDRSEARVVADTESWASRYAVDAVMLDQLPSGLPGAERTADRAVELIATVRSTGVRWIAGNAGTDVHPRIAGLLDVVGVYEREGRARAPGRFARHRHKHWILVHGARAGDEKQIARMCAGAGYAWATRATLPQPWDGSGWCPGGQAGPR